MASTPSPEQAAARDELISCEKEIQSIKAALRRLGGAGNADEPNSLEIVLLKIEGLPEAAKPVLNLQLSSPIEEGTLSEVFNSSSNEAPADGSVVTFTGVETSTATLTVSAKDADISLGSSTPHDIAPLCAINPMEVKEKYVTELPVAIVAEDNKGGTTSDAKAEKSGESTSEVVLPVCTVSLKITYKPSPKDQREELYEVLNKTSQRKASAVESLRKISMSMTRDGASSGDSSAITKPSVKPGFLNKKAKERTKLQKVYDQTIGPNSMLVKGLGIALVTRNYLIFFGAVTAFHFKGQLLSLPPPV